MFNFLKVVKKKTWNPLKNPQTVYLSWNILEMFWKTLETTFKHIWHILESLLKPKAGFLHLKREISMKIQYWMQGAPSIYANLWKELSKNFLKKSMNEKWKIH